MAETLAETCLYTIRHPDHLAEDAARGVPAEIAVETRMVAAARLFREAAAAGRDVAVLFGDATRCSRLIYWGLLTGVEVAPEGTRYTAFPVRPLGSIRKTQKLVLRSTGERIAERFIRPYAICLTPAFLAREIASDGREGSTIAPPDPLTEGAVRRSTVIDYGRDLAARQRCIDHYGSTCVACGLDFGAVYGPIAVGFIHVHHLDPLSEIGGEHEVDPIADLRPVCPNCHAVIHMHGECRDIEEVRRLLRNARKTT